jgi:hypothetical protein
MRHSYKGNRVAFCSIVGACALFPTSASALDWGLQPRLDAGGMYYSLDIKGNIDQLTGVTFGDAREAGNLEAIEAVMPMVSGGVTGYVDDFFVDLSAVAAFDGESDFIDRSVGPTIEGAGGARRITANTDFDRQEYAVSAGMRVTNDIAFFGGYKFARTNFQDVKINDVQTGNAVLDFTDRYTFDNRFDQSGFFFGGTIGREIGTAGLLSLKVAIAFLSGDMSVTGQDVFTRTDVQSGVTTSQVLPIDNTIKGDTTGVTVGLSWKGSIPQVEGLSYTLSVDGYSYEFDGTFVRDPNGQGLEPPSFAETVARFSAGVAYAF